MIDATPILYTEGLVLEVDLTPPWWSGTDTITVCCAAFRALTDSLEDAAYISDYTLGISGVKVRMTPPATATQADIARWRSRMMARIDARPEIYPVRESWKQIQAEREAETLERRAKIRRSQPG